MTTPDLTISYKFIPDFDTHLAEMFEHVFVTVGTTSFQKLIETILSEPVKEQFSVWGVKEVRIQGGDKSVPAEANEWSDKETKYILYDYKESLLEDMEWADLIICHAGAGTTIEALDLGKTVLVVPNETLMDNHQLELANKLAKEKYAFKATLDTFVGTLSTINPEEIVPFPQPNVQPFIENLKKYLIDPVQDDEDEDE